MPIVRKEWGEYEDYPYFDIGDRVVDLGFTPYGRVTGRVVRIYSTPGRAVSVGDVLVRGPVYLIQSDQGQYSYGQEWIPRRWLRKIGTVRENPIYPKEWGEPWQAMKNLVQQHFNIPRLAEDLRNEPYRITERHHRRYGLFRWIRIDRMIFVGSYKQIERYTEQALPRANVVRAYEEGWFHELTSQYLTALAGSVEAVLGQHVYWTSENGDEFIGQYEEGEEADLRARFRIED